jgi:hypothetical protein
MNKKHSLEMHKLDNFNITLIFMYFIIIISIIIAINSTLGIELKYNNMNIISKKRHILIYTLCILSVIYIFILPLLSVFTNRCGFKYTKHFYIELLLAFIITIFIVNPDILNIFINNNSRNNKQDCEYNNVICYNSKIYSLYKTYKSNNYSQSRLEKLLKNNKNIFSYNENDELLHDDKTIKRNVRKILSKSHPDKIRNVQDDRMRVFINTLYITATNL